MASDWSPHSRLDPDSETSDSSTLSEKAASEVGALVAEQVRQAIAVAESSALELQRQALDHASADRAAVRETATQMLSRIDRIEAKFVEFVQELRDEAMQIARETEATQIAGETEVASAVPGPEPALPAEPSSMPEPAPEAVSEWPPATDNGVRQADEAGLAEDAAVEDADEPQAAPEAASEAMTVGPADDAGWAGDSAAEQGDESQPAGEAPAEASDRWPEPGISWPDDAATTSAESQDPGAADRRRRRGLFGHRRSA
jgi:hypothetical protein